MKRALRCALAATVAMVGVSCALDKVAINMVADSLSSGGGAANAFTSDDDPILVGDALPFALKLYETLLEKDPTNAALALQTGSLFVMYANAYVQGPAEMLPEADFKEQASELKRAKALYLRGRDYVLRGIEIRHPGFSRAVADRAKGDFDRLLAEMRKPDVPYLYWVSAGWMAAYAINPLDFSLALTVDRPLAMMSRAEQLDETFADGAIPEFYVSYDAAAPASMGGGLDKARSEFERAVAIEGGKRASAYVAMAEAVAVREHNEREFRELLGKALAIDPDVDPDSRLLNVIAQERARWLLENIDDYFLSP